MSIFRFELALAEVNGLLIAKSGGALGLNKIISDREPWGMSGMPKQQLLWQLAEGLRHIALMLLPFIPETAQRISVQLNVPYAKKMLEKDFVITDEMKQWGSQKAWKTVGEPEILFPPVE